MAMLRAAALDGIRGMAATPHAKDVREAEALLRVREHVDTLNKLARDGGLNLKVYVGMENHLTSDLPDLLATWNAFSYNDGLFVLVELPFDSLPNYTNDVLAKLLGQGFIPVIAHPERQTDIMKNPSIMGEWAARGMLGQVTSTCIMGRFGDDERDVAKTLLRNGWVHVISTDCHRPTGPRAPKLAEAVAEAGKIVGEEKARAMAVETPKAILMG